MVVSRPQKWRPAQVSQQIFEIGTQPVMQEMILLGVMIQPVTQYKHRHGAGVDATIEIPIAANGTGTDLNWGKIGKEAFWGGVGGLLTGGVSALRKLSKLKKLVDTKEKEMLMVDARY